MKQWSLVACLFILFTGQVAAHEMRPAYLEINELTPFAYSVLWKVPMRGDMRLRLDPDFPDNCGEVVPPSVRSTSGALISNWNIQCDNGLSGQRIGIEGLGNTLTDVLARVQHLDGAVQTTRITPGEPSFSVEASPSKLALAATYLWLGVEHILLGVDHLLFVLGASPTDTVSPSATKTSVIVPDRGAGTIVSIFIASTISSGSPSLTAAPGLTCTLNTLPARDALTGSPPPDGAACATAGAAGATLASCPLSATSTVKDLPLTRTE